MATNPKRKRSEFVYDLEYRNTLPDVPFEPKLLTYPHDPERLFKFRTTTLEQKPPIIHRSPSFGEAVELLDQAYSASKASRGSLHQWDRELINELLSRKGKHKNDDSKDASKSLPQELRSRGGEEARKNKSFLVRTSYIDNELGKQTNAQESRDSVEARQREVVEKKERELLANKDRRDWKRRIEDSFKSLHAKPRHPHKPHLRAKKVRALVPDLRLAQISQNLLTFKDPEVDADDDEEREAKFVQSDDRAYSRKIKRRMAKSILRSMRALPDSLSEDAVLSLLVSEAFKPDPHSKEASGDANFDPRRHKLMKWVRDYTLGVVNPPSNAAESLMLVFDDDHVRYVPLESREFELSREHRLKDALAFGRNKRGLLQLSLKRRNALIEARSRRLVLKRRDRLQSSESESIKRKRVLLGLKPEEKHWNTKTADPFMWNSEVFPQGVSDDEIDLNLRKVADSEKAKGKKEKAENDDDDDNLFGSSSDSD